MCVLKAPIVTSSAYMMDVFQVGIQIIQCLEIRWSGAVITKMVIFGVLNVLLLGIV